MPIACDWITKNAANKAAAFFVFPGRLCARCSFSQLISPVVAMTFANLVRVQRSASQAYQ